MPDNEPIPYARKTWTGLFAEAFTWTHKGQPEAIPVAVVKILDSLATEIEAAGGNPVRTSRAFELNPVLDRMGQIDKQSMAYWLQPLTIVHSKGRAATRTLNTLGQDIVDQWRAAQAKTTHFMVDGRKLTRMELGKQRPELDAWAVKARPGDVHESGVIALR